MSSPSLPFRTRVHRALVIATPLALTLAVIAACNTSTGLQPKGAECFLASDCQPGLVCVEVNKQRVCTDDISGVAGRPPPEGGAPMEAGEGGEAGESDGPIVEPDANPNDTSIPDTFKPDTAPPVDSSTD